MYENAFNAIEKALRAEEGISNELDYVEQTSWVLFLKYLHDLEGERRDRAELEGKDYAPIIDGRFRWDRWAAPRTNGQFDHNTAMTGDDLVRFVDQDLFPHLARFHERATGPDTIEYKIGEVFTELRSKFRSGYILRDVLEIIDGLHFKTQADKHELSSLYETRIRRMGNAGRNGGEYYTPRPLIRAMIKVVNPQIGETIYDGAVGSAGFLCEAYDHMRSPTMSASDYEILQRRTFYGQEKKSLAYVIGIMNMVLHGIEAPNIVHANTLNENVMDIQEKDRHDVILANPPFGGGERREVQQNFPIKSGETAYLFLQHFIRKLRAGARAAVIKNTFLSNTDNASVALRRELLEACNLHSILDCPQGTFQGAGVKTVVLFFQKGEPTRRIWYYQLDPGRSMGKTNPLNDDDMAEFVALQRGFVTGPKSWAVHVADVDAATFDLSAKNPNAPEAEPPKPPGPKPEPPEPPEPPEDGGEEGDEPKAKLIIKLADGKERAIQHIAATTYWGPDGKPMTAQQFLERLFGDLSDMISDEDELRRQWSNPESRERFIALLEQRGYDADKLSDMRRLIDAPNSDLFDVLAYIRFTTPPKTRADRASAARGDGLASADAKAGVPSGRPASL